MIKNRSTSSDPLDTARQVFPFYLNYFHVKQLFLALKKGTTSENVCTFFRSRLFIAAMFTLGPFTLRLLCPQDYCLWIICLWTVHPPKLLCPQDYCPLIICLWTVNLPDCFAPRSLVSSTGCGSVALSWH